MPSTAWPLRKLPPDVPAFLRNAAAQLAYLAPEPDRWRETSELALKRSQEPDHFIDLEMVEGMDLPPDRYSFYRALAAKRAQTPGNPEDLLPERVGLQPYITIEVYERLVVAFREYRRALLAHRNPDFAEANAIFYAGWLGHYVGDGANPMHTTIHHNGWIGPNPKHYTTANTVHWKMEGIFVAANLKQLQFADLVPAQPHLADRSLPRLPALSRRLSSTSGDCVSTGERRRLRRRGNSRLARFHPPSPGRRSRDVAKYVVQRLDTERTRLECAGGLGVDWKFEPNEACAARGSVEQTLSGRGH